MHSTNSRFNPSGENRKSTIIRKMQESIVPCGKREGITDDFSKPFICGLCLSSFRRKEHLNGTSLPCTKAKDRSSAYLEPGFIYFWGDVLAFRDQVIANFGTAILTKDRAYNRNLSFAYKLFSSAPRG